MNMHSLGFFVAPNYPIPMPNPVRAAYAAAGVGDIVDAHYTLPSNPFGLGAIVDGIYSMPSNAVVDDLNARIAMAEALQKYPVGLSCGPATCPCQTGLCGPGMGDLTADLSSLMGKVTGSLSGWQTWAVVGAGVAALVLLTGGGGSQRRAELTAARAQYKAKVASIRASRPRRYQKFV
jgi:hypothetical protein